MGLGASLLEPTEVAYDPLAVVATSIRVRARGGRAELAREDREARRSRPPGVRSS